MKAKIIPAFLFFFALMSGPSFAEGFILGEETKGVGFSSDTSDLNIRIRLQPRFDYGDIIRSKDGTSYETDSDLYLRRARLELTGHLVTKTIKYNLTLSADRWEQAGHTDEVGVLYANVQWDIQESAAFIVGKDKLPFSRVSLTSSSKQLLIERPVSTEAAKRVFGETDAYYQPKIAARGALAGGVFAYEIAFADGWQNGEAIESGRTVHKANPLYVARVELSPPGWVEKSKSDAPLGKGQHLTLGLNYANQSAIEYDENSSEEDRTLLGLDISGHYMGITAQFEYNAWDIDSTDPSISDKKPQGWYLQAGYFIEGFNIEPAARYEVYDQNSDRSEMEERDTTVGVNWYAKGHSLKVGVNWLHAEYDANASGRLTNDDKKDVYQIQAQMYF